MTSSNKFCKDLLGLCFTSPDESRDQYFHAFSFDHDILNNMINNNVKDNEKNFYSIKNIKLYKYFPLKKCVLNNKVIKGMYVCMNNNDIYDNNELNLIYGYNYIEEENYLCEQVLLSTEVINEEMIHAGISLNPINIDTFYEESILNA